MTVQTAGMMSACQTGRDRIGMSSGMVASGRRGDDFAHQLTVFIGQFLHPASFFKRWRGIRWDVSNNMDIKGGELSHGAITHVADQVDASPSGGCYWFDDPRAPVFGKITWVRDEEVQATFHLTVNLLPTGGRGGAYCRIPDTRREAQKSVERCGSSSVRESAAFAGCFCRGGLCASVRKTWKWGCVTNGRLRRGSMRNSTIRPTSVALLPGKVVDLLEVLKVA